MERLVEGGGGRFSAVFFDLDGTLMDHKGASEEAVVRLLDRYGITGLRRAEAPSLWRRLEEEHMGRYLAGKSSFAQQRRARTLGLFEWLGIRLKLSEADEAFSIYLGFYEFGWRTFGDVAPALDALGDVRKGVLTNGNPDQQRKKIRTLGLEGRFEVVIVSGEVGASKPDPAIFRAACAAVGLDPASCVHVGDSLDADARAARKAGMRGVWLNRRPANGGARSREDGLPVVRELTGLPGILREP